jgi:hypothetical protein
LIPLGVKALAALAVRHAESASHPPGEAKNHRRGPFALGSCDWVASYSALPEPMLARSGLGVQRTGQPTRGMICVMRWLRWMAALFAASLGVFVVGTTVEGLWGSGENGGTNRVVVDWVTSLHVATVSLAHLLVPRRRRGLVSALLSARATVRS